MSARSLLAIASINELTRISIDFVIVVTQDYIDVDVFMDFPLGTGVDWNRG